MNEIKVLGHINPDTDSTCTPVVYAWYLTEKKGTSAKAVIANDPNREALYLLERFGFDKPETILELSENDKVVIMDTNNAEELVSGFEKAEIIEIIDHHKLFGNISTQSPVKVTMWPLACVATIVWKMMKADSNSDIPSNIAGMLLGAILSDTLKFTSPTTTQEDKEAANELAKIAGVEIDELAEKMFEAKSDLTGMDADDILHMDSKIFDLGKKIRISVLETTKPENALSMRDEIKNRMIELKEEEGLDMILFYIVDIINSSSQVIVTNEDEKNLVEKAHKVAFSGEDINLPGVVSRKKQMVPAIEEVLA